MGRDWGRALGRRWARYFSKLLATQSRPVYRSALLSSRINLCFDTVILSVPPACPQRRS